MVMYFKTEICVIVCCFVSLIHYTETALRLSRQTSNWTDASNQCKEFGGYLATVDNLDDLKEWVKKHQLTSSLEGGEEVWVGAKLVTSQWKWNGETNNIYKEATSYEKLGCYKEEVWFQGTQLTGMTPDLCLQHCNVRGLVGLQKDRCICEENMGNTSMIRRGGVCHFLCPGNPREMCGGLHGISVFKPAAHKITWLKEDKNNNGDCVLLRKRSREPEWHMKVSNCDLQTRYLCSFRDHVKCGDYHTCVRWSSDQSTWSKSRSRCEDMSGHLAELANGFGEYSQDLLNLPPGSYWLSLRRDRYWTWVNGSRIAPSDMFGQTRRFAGNDTCAVVQNINGIFRVSPRPCHVKRTFLCEYDFDDKPRADHITDPKLVTETATKMATLQREATWRRNPFFNDGYNITISLESQTDESDTSNSEAVLNTCMHLLLGFVAGTACVLLIGLVVYLICRCRQPDPKKHERLGDDPSRHDNQSVTYSSKDDSIHIQSPPSDITYDSVYDGESPFRRTQRLIRMGSANAWRPAPVHQPRRERSDTQNSQTSDYAWRGMIDGNVEIINTELRHQKPTIRGAGNYCEVEYDLHHINEQENSTPRRFKVSINSASSMHDEITTDLDALENHYDIPERPSRESSDHTRRLSGVSGNRRVSGQSTGSDVVFPKFLELENQVDEFSNEENIYASIKKTFQKIERDLNKSTNNDRESAISN